MNDERPEYKEAPKQKPISISLLSLHTHWITADAIKERMRFNVGGVEGQVPTELEDLGQEMSKMQTMVVFYALFYVVIEGYRELKLKDDTVDALLSKNDYEDRLRRFRNAVFHYQKYPFDKRLIEFLDAKDSEHWIRQLYAAFTRFFLRELPIRESLERLNKGESLREAMGEYAK
ncbi:MAG: hypothetical protein K2Z80_30835 [Xanthobacteraceae bacterium]|nr:hypothetical protein [Xanthobacteraceae bacterium]